MSLNRPVPKNAEPVRVAIVERDARRARALAHAASLVLTPAPVILAKVSLAELESEHGADLVVLTQLGVSERSVVTRLARDTAMLLLADASEESARRFVEWGIQDVLPFSSIEGEDFGRAVRLGLVRSRRERELRRMALVDELTRLYNRRGFLLVAQERLASLLRRKAPAVLAYLDLDGMKRINDTFGHEAGDRALVTLADAMRRSFRASDVLGRIGGDEFVALAEDASRADTLLMEARLRRRLSETVAESVETSVGWAILDPERPASLQELLGAADRSMYLAKRRGRFRVV
ncbi:MAG: GGDEF domain-containing protein [Fimbriimonadaceae bacterium]|nr:GGDEF domain-containing protein [Fimbriimonadaceae bacterium]